MAKFAVVFAAMHQWQFGQQPPHIIVVEPLRNDRNGRVDILQRVKRQANLPETAVFRKSPRSAKALHFGSFKAISFDTTTH